MITFIILKHLGIVSNFVLAFFSSSMELGYYCLNPVRIDSIFMRQNINLKAYFFSDNKIGFLCVALWNVVDMV